jgi:hypothetical protein
LQPLAAAGENRSIMAQSDQLRVPDAVRSDPKSFELLRVWVACQDQHISLRAGVWEDPASWGTMLADLARHIANSFETYENRNAIEVLQSIRAGFEAEIQAPIDPVRGEFARNDPDHHSRRQNP